MQPTVTVQEMDGEYYIQSEEMETSLRDVRLYIRYCKMRVKNIPFSHDLFTYNRKNVCESMWLFDCYLCFTSTGISISANEMVITIGRSEIS